MLLFCGQAAEQRQDLRVAELQRSEAALRAALLDSQQHLASANVDRRKLEKQLVSRNVISKGDPILQSKSLMLDLIQRLVQGSTASLAEFIAILLQMGHMDLFKTLLSRSLPVSTARLVIRGSELSVNISNNPRSRAYTIQSLCLVSRSTS